VGYAYGSMLAPGGWWKGSERRSDLRGSVFALSELMVLPKWRGTGRARKIHDALIAPVAADMVSLQVETAHAKVVRLYESWGYENVDEFKQDDDSPRYTVMVKRLPGAASDGGSRRGHERPGPP
jgi:GNAT superfamily N-acetyltransferase